MIAQVTREYSLRFKSINETISNKSSVTTDV